MAISDSDPALIAKLRSMCKWPLPCQMVFVLKPLTQTQQSEVDSEDAEKHKSRLVTCGDFAARSKQSTTTTNLDAPLLRLILSLATAEDATWSSVDITNSFLNVDIHDEDIALVTPPPILVKMNIVKPNTVQMAKRGIKFTYMTTTEMTAPF